MSNMNAYEFFKIGDTFHNCNGEDYIILNLSAERDKALLVKKLDEKETKIYKSSAIFIGAKGLSMKEWCHGHYFMTDFQKAIEWFLTDDIKDKNPKLMSVEEFFEKCITYDGGYWFTFIIRKFNNISKMSELFENYSDVPNALKKGYIVEWEVMSKETEMNCSELQVPYFIIYLDLRYNPELRSYYNIFSATWE